MKYAIIVLVFTFFIPKKITKASDVKRTVTQTRLNYHLVVADVIEYQINKKFEKIENKIDSLKSKLQS